MSNAKDKIFHNFSLSLLINEKIIHDIDIFKIPWLFTKIIVTVKIIN